jgi:hypothetical protein
MQPTPTPPLLQGRARIEGVCFFLEHIMATLKEDEEPEAGLLLLRQLVSPALAACMVKTLDTLLGYHHTHLQHSQVTD